MRTYTVRAINVGSFNLGEADRVLTLFSAEKGLLKAIAKGSRKPGAKMSGRSDLLCVNELLLARGRSFEIITQAQTVESFPRLRKDLPTLSYGLYFAELTACFGQGFEDDSANYFRFLIDSLSRLSDQASDPLSFCLEFEFGLLDFLGERPELTFCVVCREAINEYNLSRFNHELGGLVCTACYQKSRQLSLREASDNDDSSLVRENLRGIQITALVWKTLVLSASGQSNSQPLPASSAFVQAQQAGQRLLQGYIEQRAGKRFKSLDLLSRI